MWNKLTIIWHGLSGHFRGYHAVESRYWLYVIGSVVSLVILWVNSSVSFNFYRFNVLTKAIGLGEQISFIGACSSHLYSRICRLGDTGFPGLLDFSQIE